MPQYFKKDRKNKNNSKPVSILLYVYKKYTKCICYSKLINILNLFLSKFQCGFCEGHSSYCLLVIIENIIKILDNKGIFCEVFKYLLKEVSYTPHTLLISELSEYGFDRGLSFFSPSLHN